MNPVDFECLSSKKVRDLLYSYRRRIQYLESEVQRCKGNLYDDRMGDFNAEPYTLIRKSQ